MTSRQLRAVGARLGSRVPNVAGDLIDNRELTQHTYIPILTQQGTQKRYYHWGSGLEDNETEVGRRSMDLKVADDDSGTNSADAVGTARFSVYPDDPSRSEPKATGDELTLAELRSWSSLNHRERGLFPVKKPGASKDEYLALEVRIDSSQEGQLVYAENSSITAPMSEVKIR